MSFLLNTRNLYSMRTHTVVAKYLCILFLYACVDMRVTHNTVAVAAAAAAVVAISARIVVAAAHPVAHPITTVVGRRGDGPGTGTLHRRHRTTNNSHMTGRST